MNPDSPAEDWLARPIPAGPPTLPQQESIDGEWRPLRQAWLGFNGPDPINPGWTRARWSPEELRFEAVFTGKGAHNRASRLNDRTWELGDICEVFLLVPGARTYLELHVTPENQRLQLKWPFDGLERFRAGAARLEDFTVNDPTWIDSETEVAIEAWIARMRIPTAVLGLPTLTRGLLFHAAVCRYDCTLGAEPRLSSTAPLTAPNYHRLAEWEPLTLA